MRVGRLTCWSKVRDALGLDENLRSDVSVWWGRLWLRNVLCWCSAAGAGVAAPGGLSFVEEKGNGCEGCEGVEPRDVEGGVEPEAGEGDDREIGAGGGLNRVGGEGGVAAAASFAALERGEKGHGDERGDRDGDACGAGLGLQLEDEGGDGDGCDHEGERKEESPGDAAGAMLREAERGRPLQQDDGGGEEFDEAVRAEGQQHRAAGRDGCVDRDTELDEHPCQGDGLEPEHVLRRRGSAGGGAGGGVSDLGQVGHVVVLMIAGRGGVRKGGLYAANVAGWKRLCFVVDFGRLLRLDKTLMCASCKLCRAHPD